MRLFLSLIHICLYPSNQISPNTTPDLAAAARETLERRGDGGTGWSRAWKISFWARLHDGNRAYKLLKSLLEPTFDSAMQRDVYKRQNSGSPVLNAQAELVGLAFDGNWESLSGDILFNPAMNRTISVDILYVLYVIDKVMKAPWIIDELKLVE